jgi:hypothetical protein
VEKTSIEVLTFDLDTHRLKTFVSAKLQGKNGPTIRINRIKSDFVIAKMRTLGVDAKLQPET